MGETASYERRPATRHVGGRVVAGLVLAAALLAACGSDGTSSSTSATTAASGSASAAASAGGACPFSGAVQTVSVPGPGTPAATLTDILPNPSGCVDQVRLNFSPALVPAVVGYNVSGVTTTTVAGSGPQLIVKLGGPAVAGGTSSASAQQAASVTWNGPSTIAPASLTHVKQITVQRGDAGEVDVILTLDGKGQFLTSTSSVPAYLVVSVAPAG